jgi:hypothetical protein
VKKTQVNKILKIVVEDEVTKLERVQSFLEIQMELENRETQFTEGLAAEG